MTARTVLVTGFEPFGGARRNPSWDVAQALAGDGADDQVPGREPGVLDTRVVARRLPVTFGGVRPALAAAIAEVEPAVVLSLGLAAGRGRVEVERVAVNLAHARIPDNDGAAPREEAVRPGGPDGYLTRLPVARILADARGRGLAVADSLTAGAYVCNATMYHLLDLTAGSGVVAGFVHVPATGTDSLADHDPLAASVPLVPLDDVVAAVRAVLASTLTALAGPERAMLDATAGVATC